MNADRPNLIQELSKVARRLLGGPNQGSAFLQQPPPAPEKAPAREPAELVWRTSEGQILQGRWKGFNAAIWWPMKEYDGTLILDKVTEHIVFARTEKAAFEFRLTAFAGFIKAEDLLQARRKMDFGNRLYVQMKEYEIVAASLVPREKNRGIA